MQQTGRKRPRDNLSTSLPDPTELVAAYSTLEPAGTTGDDLIFPCEERDAEAVTWQFWIALASAEVFVKDMWQDTEYVKGNKVKVNAQPGKKSVGQIVVKSVYGTVILVLRDKHLHVTKGGDDFKERLSKVFPSRT